MTTHENNYQHFGETHDNRIERDATARQLACYTRLLNLPSNSTVIDVACGFGRHTIPLAQSYERVIGIDHDPHMLEAAKAQARELGAQATFKKGDMRALDLPSNSFDGVLNGFSSWGFYGPDDDTKALREMARILKPGGTLVLDYGNIEARKREIAEKGVDHLGVRTLCEVFTDDHGNDPVNRYSWINGPWYHWLCERVVTKQRLVNGLQYGYTPEVLQQMFTDVGLEVISSHGDYEEAAPVNDQHLRLIVVATKPIDPAR